MKRNRVNTQLSNMIGLSNKYYKHKKITSRSQIFHIAMVLYSMTRWKKRCSCVFIATLARQLRVYPKTHTNILSFQLLYSAKFTNHLWKKRLN